MKPHRASVPWALEVSVQTASRARLGEESREGVKVLSNK